MSSIDLLFGKALLDDEYNEVIQEKPVGTTVSEYETQPPTRCGLCMTAPTIPDEIVYKQILAAYVYVYTSRMDTWSDGSYQYPCLEAFSAPFNYDAVTSFTKRPATTGYGDIDIKEDDYLPTWLYRQVGSTVVKKLLTNGARIELFASTIYTPNSDKGPFVRLELGDAIKPVFELLYPLKNSVISRSTPTTFQWTLGIEGEALEPVTIKNVTFMWRYVGSEQLNSVNLQNTTQYTVPAGTFETGSIEWRILVTATSGASVGSGFLQVEVSEPTSTAMAISPKETIVDGASPIEFKWNHISSNGTAQTGFDLQVSRDLLQWTTIASEKTAQTHTTIPERTLSSGDVYWRVRTYNLDDIAGDWSDPAHIIVLAAPETPSVALVSNDPKFSIRWDQTEQQGYEISINDTVVAKKYTPTSAYTYDKYLAPGTYDVFVRIQNKFGYWSGWGKCIATIEDYGENLIPLNVKVDGHIVNLSWSEADEYDGYIVYRNGIKIGETTEMNFVDQFAAGETIYLVRGIFNDNGKCQVSQEKTVFVSVKNLMIAERENPNWISLPQSTSSLRATSAVKSCSVTYSHFAGSPLPDADVGEQQSSTFILDCAWKNSDLRDADAFEALLGKAVVVKTITGKTFTAILESLQSETNRFWTSLTAQLTQIGTEDETI